MNGQEILEDIKAGKKEWDALTDQEWATLQAYFQGIPGTLAHTIANLNRQDIKAAAAILHRIKAIIEAAGRETWEHITAEELLTQLDRWA